MDFKLLGSILLIVGTCIGAGMLALPLATAALGFWGSLLLLIICWFLMTAGAFLLLEINLWMPHNSNLNTMARATIGPIGQIISWLAFLTLLYSLLCAYIDGGSDLFQHLLNLAGIDVSRSLAAILFTLVFGSVVYLGIRSIDYVNRGLMLIKLTAYLCVILLLAPFISATKLAEGDLHHITSATAIMVTITSFGYSPIIPSLRIYLGGDIAKLKKAILIGSLIPLICYIAWDAAIMGVLPIGGEQGLMAILHSRSSTSDLVTAISKTTGHDLITLAARVFTSVCILTSFLGVSLCLSDFWVDGLRMEKKGLGNLCITLLIFAPALAIALFFPGVFVTALKYAGIDCVILLLLLPAWMAWYGRYRKRLTHGFTVWGGKLLLSILIVFSLVMMAQGLSG
jgi:tyrosine-specific transport protein